MPIINKNDLNIESNTKLQMVLMSERNSENVSGHLEYSDYSACVFCVT